MPMTTELTVALVVTGILFLGIPLFWFVLSSIFLRGSCPRCGWGQIRPSMPHSAIDWLLRFFLIGAFRCRVCRSRFYRFRIRTSTLALVGSEEATSRIASKPLMNRPRQIAKKHNPILSARTASAAEPSTFQANSQWQRSDSTAFTEFADSASRKTTKAASDA